ncbi:MAG: AAA family ATPase [Novosphingobium sp.]|nr:AAA family ATPase [Novosphingobium sp.]
MAGQIVLISGTSGSGKTTTCATLAKRADDCCLQFGMDLTVGTLIPGQYTLFGDKKEEGYQPTKYGPACMTALSAMHAMIAAASRTGQNMVVDHLMFVDPPVLQDCIWRMQDVPVLFVNLRPSFEILEKRITERNIELPEQMVEALGGPDGVKQLGEQLAAVRPWFYEHAYANEIYDLEIDSSALSPDEVCEMIEERIAKGPGKAFEQLRRKYPKPFA